MQRNYLVAIPLGEVRGLFASVLQIHRGNKDGLKNSNLGEKN